MNMEKDNSPWTAEDESMESLYAAIGCALIGCQIAEKWLVLCLTCLFPDEPIEDSVEAFDRIDHQNRRKMLGQLVRELRKRVHLAEEFGKLLSDWKRIGPHLHDLVF
jgi:hypothetical protein